MKKFLVGVISVLVIACSKSPNMFFLNRMITMDEGFSRIKERKMIPIVILRYRWLSHSQALLYGMDEEQNRGWWLWDGLGGDFFPLEGEVQGFDVSGKTILVVGRVWNGGYPLWLGRLEGRRFIREKELHFSMIPENSASTSGGFYLAGKDREGIHRIYFLSTNAELKEVLSLTNKEATIRFVRTSGRLVVYTSYEMEQKEPSLFSFVEEEKPAWERLLERGTVVQKAVSLHDVVAFPVSENGNIRWVVFDTMMRQVGWGPRWEAVVFEELFDNYGAGKGVFLCLLPAEKRSVLMIFRWDGVNWQWRMLMP